MKKFTTLHLLAGLTALLVALTGVTADAVPLKSNGQGNGNGTGNGAGQNVLSPAFCSDGSSHPYGLDVRDVNFRGVDSSDCFGVVEGNGKLEDVNGLSAESIPLWEGGWSGTAKSDSSSSYLDFFGVRWTLTADNKSTGEWTLTVSDLGALPDLPITVDMMVLLKAGNHWASYRFADQYFESGELNGGRFSIKFNPNPAENFNALSHMSLFLKNGREQDSCAGDVCSTVQIPEPTSLALLGAGLAGMATARRRRRF